MMKEKDVIQILNESEKAKGFLKFFEDRIDKEGIDRKSEKYKKFRKNTVMLAMLMEEKAIDAMAHNTYYEIRNEME